MIVLGIWKGNNMFGYDELIEELEDMFENNLYSKNEKLLVLRSDHPIDEYYPIMEFDTLENVENYTNDILDSDSEIARDLVLHNEMLALNGVEMAAIDCYNELKRNLKFINEHFVQYGRIRSMMKLDDLED